MAALLAAALLWVGIGAGQAQAAGRVALVMVAEDYVKLQKSSVGTKRANEIAEALRARGFDVSFSANPSNSEARASLRDFSAKTAGADVAVAVLLGHGTTALGQSFFLPVNTEVSVATDLLSRGISVTTVAQIVGRAKAGAVFFVMTVPSFPSPVDGLNARPEFTGEIGKNVVTVFSTSAKVPVSRVDAASELAADALLKVLQQPAPMLADVARAASNEVGLVFGAAPEMSLAKPAVVEQVAAPAQPAPQDTQKNTEVMARLDSERTARETAEKRAREDQARAEKANAEVQRAQEDARRAQADVQKAQADARKAQADAEKAQAEAERAKAEARQIQAQAQLAKAQAEAAKASVVAAAPAMTPPMDEKLLGQKQRQRIQERLREMSLYTGPIDSIMGPLTREAIMGYQRSRGAAVTGYLTPEQFQELMGGGT
jgi:peptidoglycan hydrolase-like protein with peptidoglycan-binding domain